MNIDAETPSVTVVTTTMWKPGCIISKRDTMTPVPADFSMPMPFLISVQPAASAWGVSGQLFGEMPGKRCQRTLGDEYRRGGFATGPGGVPEAFHPPPGQCLRGEG